MEDQDLVKRNGLAFAAQIAMLASDAPDVYGEIAVQQVVTRLQHHYGYSRRAKKAAIVSYLRKNISASRSELIDHFRWHKDLVYTLTNQMLEDGEIESFKDLGPGSGAKSGRPQLRLRLPA
mgnify:CR=1 FL=1